VAVARYKGVAGYCAAVAEVEADTSVRLRGLWLAVDVGRSSTPMGAQPGRGRRGAERELDAARAGQVRPEPDHVGELDSYPILRFTEVPQVMVRIMDSAEAEVGAGELAAGPVAGAIGNAVADAVGVRVRDLPLTTAQIARAIEAS